MARVAVQFIGKGRVFMRLFVLKVMSLVFLFVGSPILATASEDPASQVLQGKASSQAATQLTPQKLRVRWINQHKTAPDFNLLNPQKMFKHPTSTKGTSSVGIIWLRRKGDALGFKNFVRKGVALKYAATSLLLDTLSEEGEGLPVPRTRITGAMDHLLIPRISTKTNPKFRALNPAERAITIRATLEIVRNHFYEHKNETCDAQSMFSHCEEDLNGKYLSSVGAQNQERLKDTIRTKVTLGTLIWKALQDQADSIQYDAEIFGRSGMSSKMFANFIKEINRATEGKLKFVPSLSQSTTPASDASSVEPTALVAKMASVRPRGQRTPAIKRNFQQVVILNEGDLKSAAMLTVDSNLLAQLPGMSSFSSEAAANSGSGDHLTIREHVQPDEPEIRSRELGPRRGSSSAESLASFDKAGKKSRWNSPYVWGVAVVGGVTVWVLKVKKPGLFDNIIAYFFGKPERLLLQTKADKDVS